MLRVVSKYAFLSIMFGLLMGCASVCPTQFPRHGDVSPAMSGLWKSKSVNHFYDIQDTGQVQLYACDPSGAYAMRDTFAGVVVNNTYTYRYKGHCPQALDAVVNGNTLEMRSPLFNISATSVAELPATCDSNAIEIRNVEPSVLTADKPQSVVVRYAYYVKGGDNPLFLKAGHTYADDGSYVLEQDLIEVQPGRQEGEIHLWFVPKKYKSVPFEIYLYMLSGADVNKHKIMFARRVVKVK